MFCTCDERTTTGARAGFARSSLHARRTCRRSLAAHGNTIFYSIRTQYLYWETTTTNKYHAQPCTCIERTATMHSYVYARSTCGQVLLRIGNISSYSMKTQYLYWEPTTTNKYRAQPQVPLVSRHQREQTNKVPVAHATRWVRAQCGNLRCPKYHCLQSGKWGVFLQFDSAPILLGSGELFFSWGFSALIDAQLRRSTNETTRPTL